MRLFQLAYQTHSSNDKEQRTFFSLSDPRQGEGHLPLKGKDSPENKTKLMKGTTRHSNHVLTWLLYKDDMGALLL